MSLYVNLFIASELTWKAKGLKFRQETRFPDEPATRLTLGCEKPVRLALNIRHPYWMTAALEVTVNGRKMDVDSRPVGYLTIDRTWTDGDVAEIALPMSLRVEPMENSPKKAAIMYGPIVLAGLLGREGFTDDMPYLGNQRAYENLPTPEVPVLVTDGKPVDEWIGRVPGRALQFKTVGVGRPKDVSLIPFYQAHHQRFTVYWDLLTEEDWQQKQAEYEAQQQRLKELQARTADQLVPERQPERDHNYQGEKSSAGMFNGRHWRHAYPGGWFSYEMKVTPDRPVDLMVTYWGSDTVSLRADVNIKKIHGIATVREDGSAHFAVPAEKNLFFQALDENYMELQRMRTFVNLLPGERRSCIGCHERRKWAPQLKSAGPLAASHPAETLIPQPGDTGPRTVHYALDIRPILDKHCIGCHGSREPGQLPAGELDLSGELTKLYDRSYESFIDKGLVSHLNDGYGSANVAPELPMTFGSHRSRLVERIRHDPCRANLTREEFIRIVTWIDANVPYYGTHEGKKNLKWRDDPDFRPLPLAGK